MFSCSLESSSSLIYFRLCGESLSACLTILLAKYFQILQYSVSLSASNPHVSSWWFFVEQFESCHTDPGFRQSLISINIPIIDGCLMKNVNASFRLSLDMNLIQRYRRIVVRNILFRSRSNMIPTYGISHNVPEILLSSDIWICISGFFFFF